MRRLLIILPLLLAAFALSAVPLRILHTNDTHGAYLPQKAKSGAQIGGYATLEYYLNKERSSAARSIYLDAGDQQTGSFFASMPYEGTIGGAVIKAFNFLHLDASTFGNHEFDQSYAHTNSLMKLANYPFVSTNLQTKDGKPFGNNPYKIISLDSLKIGIMGLTLVELPEKVKRSSIEPLNILPYKQAIDKYIDEVDRQTDLIILVTHLGYEADSLLATTLDSRVDLIVGGHTHVSIDEPWLVNGIYITSAGSHVTLLGELDIDVVNDRIASYKTAQIPLFLPEEMPVTELNNFITTIATGIEAEMGKPVATIPQDWQPDKFKETPVSRWVAEALKAQYAKPYKPDLAIINNGGIRKNIPAGDVTLRDMHELLPFNNYVVTFTCYGRDLLKMFELNQKNTIDKPYDIVQTTAEGWVTQICKGSHCNESMIYKINGKPFKPNKKYRVVSHDYIVDQWDKYLGFQPRDVQVTQDLIADAIIQQVLLQYGKK